MTSLKHPHFVELMKKHPGMFEYVKHDDHGCLYTKNCGTPLALCFNSGNIQMYFFDENKCKEIDVHVCEESNKTLKKIKIEHGFKEVIVEEIIKQKKLMFNKYSYKMENVKTFEDFEKFAIDFVEKTDKCFNKLFEEKFMKKCCICGEKYEAEKAVYGGNSTWGLWNIGKCDKRGEEYRCCDECDVKFVIPARKGKIIKWDISRAKV